MVAVYSQSLPQEDENQQQLELLPYDFASLLSDPMFDALSFSDVRSLNKDGKQAVARCMDVVFSALLRDIGFHHVSPPRDDELRQSLRAWGEETLAKVCGFAWTEVGNILEGSASIVEHFFPLAQQDSRMHMALAVAIAIHVEMGATGIPSTKALKHFLHNILLGDDNSEDWYIMYTNILKGFTRHFGAIDPRTGAFGATSLAQFIESIPTEESYSRNPPPHLSYIPPGSHTNGCGSDGFAYVFRLLSGFPGLFIAGIVKPSREEEVPYDYWITSAANLTTFINFTNDLLSWPKEVSAGETHNYMALQTLTRRQGGVPSQFQNGPCNDSQWTFRDTVYETVRAFQMASHALDQSFVNFARTCGEPERSLWKVELASQVWLGFKNGFISWHIHQPRYGLHALRSMTCSEPTIGNFH